MTPFLSTEKNVMNEIMKKVLQTQKMNVTKSLKPDEKIRIILPLYHKSFYYSNHVFFVAYILELLRGTNSLI